MPRPPGLWYGFCAHSRCLGSSLFYKFLHRVRAKGDRAGVLGGLRLLRPVRFSERLRPGRAFPIKRVQRVPRHAVRAVVFLVAILAASVLYISPPPAAGSAPTYGTTADFDAGTKNTPGDGNFGVETATDNPGVVADRLELASLKGDAFDVPDADADTFKWDVPSACTIRSPTAVLRVVSQGVLHLGANRANDNTRVGIVSSGSNTGDLDIRVRLDEVATQGNSLAFLQILNEPRCDWFQNPKTADGVLYEWAEGPADANFVLRAFTVNNGKESRCGGATTRAVDPIHLRIARVGNAWTWSFGPDGTAWAQDESCTFAVTGALFVSFLVADVRSGVRTQFDFDGYHVAAGSLGAGGFRTSGDWISPDFDVPTGMEVDRVEITGSFDATNALDRSEIRKAGTVLEAFEADNDLALDPVARACGDDLSVRLFLKGDGTGTPVLTRVEVFYSPSGFLATAETVVIGTSTGLREQCASDDIRASKTEALGPVSSFVLVDSETVAVGTRSAGDGPPSPSDLDVSDDTSVQYLESSGIVDLTTAPDLQTPGPGELDAGAFPGCLGSDDDTSCVWSEGAWSTETPFAPTAETIVAGAKAAGAFPTDIGASDDVRIEYQETGGAGGAGAPTEVDLRGDLVDNLNDNTRTVWRNPRGTQRFYVVYEDIDGLDLVYRWSADGVTWSAKQLISGTSPDNFEVAIHDSGTDLKVFLVVVEGTQITYRHGSIADTSDTIAWDSAVLVVSGTRILARTLSASLVRTSAGRLVVAYATDITVGSASYRTTRLIGSNNDGPAPTWSGDVLWDDPSGSTNNANKDKVTFNMAAFGAAGFSTRFLLAAHVPDAGSTSQYRHLSAVVRWDGSSFTNLAATTIRSPVDAADSLSCVVDSSDVLYCLVEDSNDLFSARSGTAGDHTWEALVSVQPAAVESGKSTLSIDRTATPNVLYAVYDHSASSTDLFYRTTPVTTIAWSTEVIIAYPQDVLEVSSAARDYVGGIHVAGIRNPNALFVHQIVVRVTSSEDIEPVSQSVLKGIESLGGSPGSFGQGSFARKTDGLGLQTVSGVGFEPKALILWWTRQATFSTASGHYAGIGIVASSSEQFAIAWGDDDAQAISNSGRRSAAKAVVILNGGTPTLDGEASFVSFTSEGFVLDWTTNPSPAQATIVHYAALGSMVEDAFVGQFTGPPAGFTGSRSYAGVGFRGDLAIFLGSLQTSLGDATGATMGFGAATGPASRGAASLAIPDGTTNADTEEVQWDRRVLMTFDPNLPEPTTDQEADFVSFDATGFTLSHTKTTTGDVLFWGLIVKGGNYKVGFLERPIVDGSVQSVSGIGFRPSGVLYWSTASVKSFNVAQAPEDPGAEWILGAGSDLGGVVREEVTWSGSNNMVSTTNANMQTNATKVLRDLSLSSQAVQNQADYASSDADGFTLHWPDVQPETGQKWFWLAAGEEVFSFPACLEASDDERCVYREADQGAGSFQAEVKYSWTGIETWGLEWRLFVEGRLGATNPETIRVRVFGSDEGTLSPVACSIVSPADALYDCGALTVDQLDAGAPDILLTDDASDAAESSFELDRVMIRRTFSTTHVEVRYDWAGVALGGASYELRVEGHRVNENVLVQVLTPPSTWTTRLTIASTSDLTQSYVFTPEEFNAGAPSVRFLDADPTDATPSTFRVDQVRLVRVDLTHGLALQWEWTESVDPVGSATLEIRAALTGDLEAVSVEVFDWQDMDWRATFLIAGSTETAYTTGLWTACTAALDDCEVSTPSPGSVRMRFADAGGPDASETSVHVDVGVVRTPFTSAALDVVLEWTSLGFRSGQDALIVEGRRSDEDMFVQVWDWQASVWVSRLTISSTSDVTLVHVLTADEVSATFSVRVRLVGSTDEAPDSTESSLSLDYVAIEKREYRLDVRQEIAGIGGGSFALRIEGRLAAAGENYDVFVWDWVAQDWVLVFDASFGTADSTLVHVLASSEIQAGTVRIRFVDQVELGDVDATLLEVDHVEVVLSPP